MISTELVSVLLVFPACIFMLASLVKCIGMGKGLPDVLRPKWFAMTVLILFFMAAYLGFFALQLLRVPFPLELLTSTVFFWGAVFVFLVLRLTTVTIRKFQESKERIGRVNELLTAKNTELETEVAARAKAEKMAQVRLQQLATLHTIDMMITSNLDLKMTMVVFLEQIVPQIHVDAAAILLLNPHFQTLEYGAGIGFKTNLIQETKVRLGDGPAGVAALERGIIQVEDFDKSEIEFTRKALIEEENFRSYCAIPLIAKGQVKGVLEIFQGDKPMPSLELFEYLQALAAQAAIAIDNANLFNELQSSHAELVIAYDSTIESWGKALNLRDEETEDHTQRVTEMTLHILRIYGMDEKELVHVRRGALLHDIGKMGVPDSILLKKGELTPEETKIMQQHPLNAFDILMPIVYLRPALDIPYCHHERWDGTGYPRGLKGERIPLAARVFALADTWDALISARRYREAWPREKVVEYIRSQAGTRFDPNLVDLFLANI